MARRYQPYPYRPRPSWSRRPAGFNPYRQRLYRPWPSRAQPQRPVGGGLLRAVLELLGVRWHR